MSPPSNSNPSLDKSGVYPQPRQECSNTHSEGDFLGVLPGFMYHDDLLANSQDPVHTTPDQRDPSPRTGNHSQAIPTAGLNGIHSSSSSGSPTALPPLGESQDYSTKTQSQLQHCSDNLRQHEAGSNLVAPRTPQTQWQVDVNNAVGHGDRIRCINAGMGSESQQHQHGPWAPQERSHHINYLELLAAFLALKTFATNTHNKAILLLLDNVTAIAFLNRMGGGGGGGDAFRDTLQSGSAHLEMVLGEELFIHAEHLPGKLNVRADWHPRHTQDCSDWQLHPLIFQQLQDRLGPFSIDLFASRTNVQLSTYCSWKLDPSAIAIGALSISWRDHYPYLFPPFSLLSRCLEKINRQKVEAVVIAPVWCNQVWYPLLLQSLQDAPILLPNTMDIILNPQGEPHPLVQQGHIPLAAWPVSGRVLWRKGLSDRVVSIMQMSWRTSTESAYSSVWRRWSSWCAQRQADPVSAPLNVVLDYLTKLYQEGKQYSNQYCSIGNFYAFTQISHVNGTE